MAEKRQKKQAVKAFEKETFSKDKEVTGVKHIEHRQDNTFSVENQFSASEKPVSNLPRDANHGSRTGKATSGHSVQKSEFNTGTEYRKNNKKKYYRQQQQDTSGHNVQKSEAEAEKTFLKENSFINEENGNATNFHTEDADSFQDNYHVRNTYQRSEEKGKYHKRRVQREHAHRERAKSENAKQSDYGDLQTKDATFSQGQADEFTDQKVQKAFDKSEKNRRKLQKAKDKMPTKRQYEMKRVFDEQTGKAKYVVVPVDVEKPFKPDGLGKTAVHKLQTENMYFVHRKIAETEKDNSAVEGAHKTEQRAEDIYHYMKYHRKSKAQRKRDRLERLHKKQVTADMKLEYEKFISENPHLKGNSPKKQLQRQLQKQRIKREYAKARRVGAEAKTAKETFTKTANATPFLNIMNEWFVRDTSKKIKAVLKSRGSSGNAHTSNIPPYGYLKDPENPDHWIIDEEAAEVVRRIYRMTIEGKGPYQIARELSEEKIERPSYYLGKKGLGNHASNYDKENPYMWRGNQVTTLIARPEYIGKTVNFRTFKNSYKDKKTKRADKEDWVVFDDTQEPIVDEETWLLAQKLRQNVRKAAPMGEPNVLTGKIYCADCGAPMYNHRQRKGRERIYYTAKGEKRTSHSNPADCYECSTYNLGCQRYDRHCTCHHISTKALKSIILKTIQETCHYVSLNEREFVYSLQEESAMKDIAVSETVKNRIERNQKRVHELDMLIRKIYEDNVIGRLPDRLFQSMLTDYENEQNELNKIIETDTADMQRIIGGQNNVERFLKLVKKYENITELTPAMINEFIDKILVHEPQGKGADRTTEVEIYLNYVGQFQVPVEQHEPTEEERIAAEKEAERLRRKRESNRKYMKKIREKSKEFAEHERIAEEKSSDSNVCVEQNATSKSNRQKVKGEKIA